MTFLRVFLIAVASFVGFLLLLQLGITAGEEYIGVVPQ